MAAPIFDRTSQITHLAGLYMRWEAVVLVGIAVLVIVSLASFSSFRTGARTWSRPSFFEVRDENCIEHRSAVLVEPEPSRAFTHSALRDAEPAIRCRGLAKTFEGGGSRVLALCGVDLEVSPGAITLLVGPSGCGKTTLISIIAGLLDPSEGSLHVLGNDLTASIRRPWSTFRREIGFVFQQYNLLPASECGRERVPAAIGRRRFTAKGPVSAREALAQRRPRRPRPTPSPRNSPAASSSRVAIARALVHKPRLLGL